MKRKRIEKLFDELKKSGKMPKGFTASYIYFNNIKEKIATLVIKKWHELWLDSDCKLTSKQYAKMLGVSKRKLLRIETLKYDITLKDICNICEKLNVVPKFELIKRGDEEC